MKDLLGSSAAKKRRLPVEVAHLRGLTGGSLGAAVSYLAVRGSRVEAIAGPLDVGGEAERDVNGRGDACFIASAWVAGSEMVASCRKRFSRCTSILALRFGRMGRLWSLLLAICVCLPPLRLCTATCSFSPRSGTSTACYFIAARAGPRERAAAVNATQAGRGSHLLRQLPVRTAAAAGVGPGVEDDVDRIRRGIYMERRGQPEGVHQGG